jgi:hypothetical protein
MVDETIWRSFDEAEESVWAFCIFTSTGMMSSIKYLHIDRDDVFYKGYLEPEPFI